MVKHVATIKGDPSVTYQILTDFSKYTEWFPECQKCEVTHTQGTLTDIDLVLGGFSIARMLVRYDCRPETSVTYDLLNTQDIKGFIGGYKIVPGANGTHTVLMECELTASVPRFITERMMKSSLEKQAKQLQDRNTRFAAAGAVKPPAALPAAALPAKRPRCVLRVRKSGEGVSIWYAGSEYHKDK